MLVYAKLSTEKAHLIVFLSLPLSTFFFFSFVFLGPHPWHMAVPS